MTTRFPLDKLREWFAGLVKHTRSDPTNPVELEDLMVSDVPDLPGPSTSDDVFEGEKGNSSDRIPAERKESKSTEPSSDELVDWGEVRTDLNGSTAFIISGGRGNGAAGPS